MEGRLPWLEELDPLLELGWQPGSSSGRAPLCRTVMEPWRWLHRGLDRVTSRVPLKGVGSGQGACPRGAV